MTGIYVFIAVIVLALIGLIFFKIRWSKQDRKTKSDYQDAIDQERKDEKDKGSK